ncbi:MAG: hypothetical protein QM488_18445 [Rhizobiaceae bacterium]
MTPAARIRTLEKENAALRVSNETLIEELKLLEKPLEQEAWFPDPDLNIPAKEIAVCRAFLNWSYPTADQIYEECYGLDECDISINSVQSHISKLRIRLAPFGISIGVNRGVGYVMPKADVETLRGLSDLQGRSPK